MRSRADTAIIAPLLAVSAALLGLAVIVRPGLAIPFSLESILLLALTARLLLRETDRDTLVWLRRLVFGALAVRFALAVALHFSPNLSPYLFAPDAIGYERGGQQIVDFWNGRGPEPTRFSGWKQGYWYLNAIFISAFEESTLALVVLNIFAGVWTVLVTFYLTRDLLNLRAAKMTALLTAFFPSLILWSVLNIRDSIATLLVVLIVWASVQLNQRVRTKDLLVMILALVALSAIRDYMGFLVLSGLLVGSFTAIRPDRMFGSLALGMIVVVAFTYTAERMDLFTTLRPEDVLSTAELVRTGLQSGATSAFGVGMDTSTIGGALRFLPIGAANLLFAPFPWAINSTLQLIAMPETLLWYPLFILAGRGMIMFPRRGRGAAVMIPLSVLLVVTTSYALVEGNFGTAYRHRAQIMPLFFIFSGVGLVWFNERVFRHLPWARRTRAAASGRRRRFAPPPSRR
jgi:Dolichyl-phosphate-mannose-protein mannosyltransferase